MAAHDFSSPDPYLGHFIGETETCFLCGASVCGVDVYWRGHDERTLFLHAACAKDFGCHLISDAVDAKKMNAKKWRPVPHLATQFPEKLANLRATKADGQ